MKAILVDDEPDGIRTLQKMLGAHCPAVQIVASCSSAAAAKQQIELLKPDVVFLDIQMPGKTGLEMLTEISPKDFEVIFVTAYNEYMLQALQYSAADYLLKPVDEDRLIEAVKRVEQRLDNSKKEDRTNALMYNLAQVGHPAAMRLCLPTLKGRTQLHRFSPRQRQNRHRFQTFGRLRSIAQRHLLPAGAQIVFGKHDACAGVPARRRRHGDHEQWRGN
jgi:two-component system, LytTR family, response regulator